MVVAVGFQRGTTSCQNARVEHDLALRVLHVSDAALGHRCAPALLPIGLVKGSQMQQPDEMLGGTRLDLLYCCFRNVVLQATAQLLRRNARLLCRQERARAVSLAACPRLQPWHRQQHSCTRAESLLSSCRHVSLLLAGGLG